ncbi:MAG: glycoside hydrolase family 3 [Ruminococcus sp.]|nr:glycoside hydrolase family 3 [Ruminococcus sp.]
MSKKSSKDRTLFTIIMLICIAALGLIAAVGLYFIKNAKDSSSDSGTSQVPGAAENTTETQTDSGEPATEESTQDLSSADKYDRIIAGMSLHEKICQMFIVTPESLTGYDVVTASGETTKNCLAEYPVGGLIYFTQNLEDTDQTRSMLSDANSISLDLGGLPLFLAIDEEGGDVARCADALGTTSFDPMYTYKEEGESTAYSNAYTIAKDISALGFNLDFAPVADTWSNPDNTVIGQRAYSDDFAETAKLVASAVKGFSEGGVYTTLKHFPGHGDTAEDSHYGTATSDKTLDELAQNEYLAFKSGIDAGADMVMMGHITMTAVDQLPASVSKVMITDELRGKLGYDGVVVTDSLAMGAVADMYEPSELSVKVVQAGADILLMPADLDQAVWGLENAVESGQLSEERINESLRRILILKDKKLGINE